MRVEEESDARGGRARCRRDRRLPSTSGRQRKRTRFTSLS